MTLGLIYGRFVYSSILISFYNSVQIEEKTFSEKDNLRYCF